ncbi:MAG: hypothetical protein B7733_20690, partial [Myxococcales bacterium FL481]
MKDDDAREEQQARYSELITQLQEASAGVVPGIVEDGRWREAYRVFLDWLGSRPRSYYEFGGYFVPLWEVATEAERIVLLEGPNGLSSAEAPAGDEIVEDAGGGRKSDGNKPIAGALPCR